MRWTLVAVVAVGLSACSAQRPEYLELVPRSQVFERAGEEVWWKAVAKNRQGKTFHKLEGQMTWSSSDPAVATVDEKGRVRSVGPGAARIRARWNELEGEANVEVVTVAKVTVEPAELKLEARGTPAKLTIQVFDYLGRPLRDRVPMSRCLNEDVCRATNDQVHPVDAGESKLIVSAEGRTAEARVLVGPTDPRKKRE